MLSINKLNKLIKHKFANVYFSSVSNVNYNTKINVSFFFAKIQ